MTIIGPLSVAGLVRHARPATVGGDDYHGVAVASTSERILAASPAREFAF